MGYQGHLLIWEYQLLNPGTQWDEDVYERTSSHSICSYVLQVFFFFFFFGTHNYNYLFVFGICLICIPK